MKTAHGGFICRKVWMRSNLFRTSVWQPFQVFRRGQLRTPAGSARCLFSWTKRVAKIVSSLDRHGRPDGGLRLPE